MMAPSNRILRRRPHHGLNNARGVYIIISRTVLNFTKLTELTQSQEMELNLWFVTQRLAMIIAAVETPKRPKHSVED
jgi:hypothetical protein